MRRQSQKAYPEFLRQRVGRGIALLNQKSPGWFRKISLSRLRKPQEIPDQIFPGRALGGELHLGIYSLTDSVRTALDLEAEHGFGIDVEDLPRGMEIAEAHKLLLRIWKEEIKKLRKQARQT